jgi:hypothetical protein
MRQVDFKNLALNVFWKDQKPQRFRLKNGKCAVDFHPGHTSIDLAAIHYLSSIESSPQYALALYEEDDVSGSSNQEGIAQVFELSDERLRVTQQIEWDLHYGGPYGRLDSFDEKNGTVIIRSAHYLPGDGHCCVSAVDVVTLRWDGTRFIQTSLRTELSGHGKSEGKKLP